MTDDCILVCGAGSYFDDDLRGNCSECGAAIVYRPHTAHVARKICMKCFLKRTANSRTPPVVRVPAEVRREADEYFRKQAKKN